MEANLLGKIDGGESRHLDLRPEFELASGAALDKIRYLFSAHFPHLSNRDIMPILISLHIALRKRMLSTFNPHNSQQLCSMKSLQTLIW